MKASRIIFLFLGCLIFLSGCGGSSGARMETADTLAKPAQLSERTIAADPFMLTAYERMNAPGGAVDLYIEGDGLAWVSKKQMSLNPTPKNPVALRLAAQDSAANVAYLARPCQYSGMIDPNASCDSAYWTNKRYAPEVFKAYNAALDDIKARYNVQGFNLIGFSGGGGVAAILAAQRSDVLSLRTVAGNLDHRAHSAYHHVSPLDGSLNPPDFAAKLAQIPQYHFIGGEDKIVPEVIFQSYLQALGATFCMQYKINSGASHTDGWENEWPALLALKPECRYPA